MIRISVGHGERIRGARGSPVPPQHDEVDQCKKIVDRVYQLLIDNGVEVEKFFDTQSTSQSANLDAIVNWHNRSPSTHSAPGSGLGDVSIHLNAFDHSAHGTEVLWKTQEAIAGKISAAICVAGGFTNRGAKYRSDLKFLNSTVSKAVLIETYFCDHTGDCQNADQSFEAIAHAIAETIAGIKIGAPPIEPEEPPPIEPPTEPSGENHLDLTVAGTGHFTVIFNGVPVTVGDGSDTNQVAAALSFTGDVTVTINGQDFQNFEPPAEEGAPANHRDITATVFGGSSDPNNSAYPPYDPLNDTEFYVALPANVTDVAMRDRGVQVWNRATGQTAIGKVRDKGPWTVDDDPYVFGDAIAVAVTCYENGTPLPSGPNAGKVPTNDAAIDLSPAISKAIGIDGKGKVDWDWV